MMTKERRKKGECDPKAGISITSSLCLSTTGQISTGVSATSRLYVHRTVIGRV